MKNLTKIFFSFLVLITILFGSSEISTNNMAIQRSSNTSPAIATIQDDQVYYNLFITMLYPYVEIAIQNYYSEYFTYLPGEAPYSYKFINIEKTPGKNYSFTVVLEVQPYVGPHLSVGRDRITFKIELDGVTVEKFEHLASYQLPPNYQDIIKKKFDTYQ